MENKTARVKFPDFFQKLVAGGCLADGDVQGTSDGFFAVSKSLAGILAARDITTFPNSRDQLWECDRFFDDWYLYAVPGGDGYVCSLFKMREQEHDAEEGIPADGDTPGVTVSFIAFDTDFLSRCLENPSFANRKALNLEINRVVADQGQRHHEALKAYFIRSQAEGPYLIAKWYVRFLASLAENGSIAVPDRYAALYRENRDRRETDRLPRFIDANNASAGYIVCDHQSIFIRDPENLTPYETCALLATHTADVSFHCFAAEVRYHARFLVWYARIPIPFLGRSVYDSAIRADMTIDDLELEGPAPFHNPNSRWVRRQRECHREYSNP